MTAQTLRDSGAAAAAANAGDWWNFHACTQAIRFLKRRGAKGARFEEIRDYALAHKIPEPPHVNAWGALALAMARRGLIVRTGQYASNKKGPSHARRSAYWMLNPQYPGPML